MRKICRVFTACPDPRGLAFFFYSLSIFFSWRFLERNGLDTLTFEQVLTLPIGPNFFIAVGSHFLIYLCSLLVICSVFKLVMLRDPRIIAKIPGTTIDQFLKRFLKPLTHQNYVEQVQSDALDEYLKALSRDDRLSSTWWAWRMRLEPIWLLLGHRLFKWVIDLMLGRLKGGSESLERKKPTE